MKLQARIEILAELGRYMKSNDETWLIKKEEAHRMNGWFTPEFIDMAVHSICDQFLDTAKLQQWAGQYSIPDENHRPLTIGVVMAGNIPLVGFHDFLAVFMSGHKQLIKQSSKDNVLLNYLVNKLASINPEITGLVRFSEMLKGCDAYIATGSDNSARHFEYYFSKYPHVIRRNRTSVAILDGNETDEQLDKLSDDVHLYFGLGCRNVTKIYVPRNYHFERMLKAFNRYDYFIEHNKYKNNYDYNLALHLLSKRFYMTNGHLLLIEDPAIFSPISQLNYEYYDDASVLKEKLASNDHLQCTVGAGGIAFGSTQQPNLLDYADGVDTMKFLVSL